MSLDPKGAALALHRFGLGPRAGSIAEIAEDPRGAFLAELDRPNAGLIADADLPTSGAANRAVFEYNAERNANEKRKRRDAEQAAMENPGGQNAGGENAMAAKAEGAPAQPKEVPLPRQLFLAEARARIDAAISA